MLDAEVSRMLDSYREDYIRTLRAWVAIPSVRGEAEAGAPFGRDVRRMLDAALKTGEDMGFPVRNFDGYAGDVTLGTPGDVAKDTVAVLGHLDVVPVGNGWTREPFGGALEDGKLYGRGTSDDKGPALASLFAMRAIREAGIPLRKSIRLILGCDEESGMGGIKYYMAHETMPELGFSPDASFPLINTEKGLLNLTLRFPAAEDGLRVLSLNCGERANVIAGRCEALLAGGEALAEQARAFAKETGLDYSAEVTPEGVRLTAVGIGGHSAMPKGRRSAIGMMLVLLRRLGARGGLGLLGEKMGMETDGSSLGCACRDEVYGPLTNNMGILRLAEDGWTATMDFRFPGLATDAERIIAAVKAALPGVDIRVTENKLPHHVPADSALVTGLLAAYEEETGWKGEAKAIGGGTYAKVMPQGVAFGASFPDEEDLAHMPDEHVSVDRMLLAMKIFANALIRIAR